MRKLLGMLAVLALGGCFATVGEDGRPAGSATFSLRFPAVLPPLVLVEPGVSVVRDYDDEIFYVDGLYWVRQDGRWYRTRDHRGGWGRVEVDAVPGSIARSPPGRYRHYRGDGHQRGETEQGRHGGHDHDRG